MTPLYRIELLTAKHDRETFDCGEESLNDFLKRFARQNSEKGLGRTYVAVKPDGPRILGYYTISSGAVTFDAVPENLPRYPVPVLHIGRLAVDNSVKGQRLGNALLADALTRAVRISDQLGVYAVEVYALNESAKNFYLKFGFAELADDKYHLYLPVRNIRKLLDL